LQSIAIKLVVHTPAQSWGFLLPGVSSAYMSKDNRFVARQYHPQSRRAGESCYRRNLWIEEAEDGPVAAQSAALAHLGLGVQYHPDSDTSHHGKFWASEAEVGMFQLAVVAHVGVSQYHPQNHRAGNPCYQG
jgi:hypothetical protein